MNHHRDWTRVSSGRLRKVGPRIPAGDAARRVRPMQRRVDWQEMRQVVGLGIHKIIDPLDTHWPVMHCLDRQRRRVMHEQRLITLCLDGAVTPHRRHRKSCRQDLLADLPHRDLVVVHWLAARQSDRCRSRHHRRDQERAAILRNARWVKRPSRHSRESHLAACRQIGVEHEAQAHPTCRPNKRPPAQHPALTAAISQRNHPPLCADASRICLPGGKVSPALMTITTGHFGSVASVRAARFRPRRHVVMRLAGDHHSPWWTDTSSRYGR